MLATGSGGLAVDYTKIIYVVSDAVNENCLGSQLLNFCICSAPVN